MLEELAGVIAQSLEILKGLAMLKATKIQNELTELAQANEEEPQQATQVIGFQLPEVEEYYEEDYDEDD